MERDMEEHIGLMIHMADLEITSYLKKWLAPIQLAPEQHLVIALLLRQEGLSQNEIAERLSKDKSGITRMLASLENKGFIRRTPSAGDRRSVEVYLTDEGRALKATVEEISSHMRQHLRAGFTAEEAVELKRLLTKVRENVRKR
ncbi:MarR family winged helix-turn-helix transcriptional regulator [Paenibacillus chitinolyticus]|uniref:MarR family winged helix-turn-helix transcriptional regulator n=1 Tax=Paenibacillus chitinolyticus TaxID=79263 RepID=UPI0035D7F8A6